MHYVCFHYAFEHGDIDVDQECTAGGCPSRPHESFEPKSGETIEAGQFARIGVVFLEERDGGALVRLPNGSKTTLNFDALSLDAGTVHFTQVHSGEQVHCGECDWETTAYSRIGAQETYRRHFLQAHTLRA